MLHPHLLTPRSIAVIGASENRSKPGGKVLQNLLEGGFEGKLYAVNTKPVQIDGIEYHAEVATLPSVDLAILAIPAEQCLPAVELLANNGTGAFIVFSAGFSEAGEAGKRRNDRLLEIIRSHNATLIGPNCIGIIHARYKGVFTTPIPDYHPQGCELISSSGATAVFLMEAAWATGLKFSNIYSIGNAAQTGVEDILEHLDKTFDPLTSPRTKLLYLEHIQHPFRFLKHAASLIRKGCHIAAIKAGYSESGSRAASSHTGAMATSDLLVRALFKKAGIVYCSGRMELINVACVWQNKPLQGERIAVITHAGGSAVMLTDALTTGGMSVPPIAEADGTPLLARLHPGSSVANPIDFLATGTAAQLADIIDFCEQLPYIDGMAVVFGSPGLINVKDVYDVLDQKMRQCSKPIYPVLPSLVNAEAEIQQFTQKGNVHFSDEVMLGQALAHAQLVAQPTFGNTELAEMDVLAIRNIISESNNGYLDNDSTRQLLEAAGIAVLKQVECYAESELEKACSELQFPLVMKVVGILHKTDVGGVALNIRSQEGLREEFRRMMQIRGAKGVLVQEMKKGIELFCGAVKKQSYGHLVLCGLGGIFVEVLGDLAQGLAPLSADEVQRMIRSLKGYPLIQGYRGREGCDEQRFADAVMRIASLVYLAPEIAELDINPFMGNAAELVAVDARIRIEKS